MPGKFRPSLVDRLLELVDEDLAALVAKPDATVLIGRPLAPRLEALRGALLACSYEASVRVRIRDGVYEWRTTRRVDADAFAEDVVDAVAAAYGLTREPLEP